MDQTDYQYNEKDLEKIDQEVRKIMEACHRLSIFSRAKGGIPAIDSNLTRIAASLKNIAGIGEILKILREEHKEVFKNK